MFIGKLNDKYSDIKIEYFKKNLKKVPLTTADGNPFRGELLGFDWSELTSNGIDLHVSLSEEFYVNQIVIYLGERTLPYGIDLYDYEKKEKIYSYRGETNTFISKKIVPLSVEKKLKDFTIEFDSDFYSVNIEKIEIFGADFEGEKVYPTPSEISVYQGVVPLEKLSEVAFDCEDAEAAFCVFGEKLFDKTGASVRENKDGFVRFILDPNEKKNGYTLSVSDEGVVLSASDRKGFVQGVETILKLMNENTLPHCKVSDAPFCEFRGVHLFLPAEDQMEFAKRLIADFLSPLGYNFIIMQFSAAMKLDSHPEINDSFLEVIEKSHSGEWPPFPHDTVGGGKIVSKESVRDLVDFAKLYGIEIVPEIQSLGHVQYMTLSHPEIAEIPEVSEDEETDERLADTRPETFYHHSACPSNPKTYEILFDILDEILDVVKPSEYVHMGHDEVYEIGVCPVCKGKDPSDLYAQDVIKIHDYLAEKGLKMMIWADMLQPASGYQTIPAIDKIPKDVLLLDFIWYFRRKEDIEEHLLSHGFEILFGNMYSSHFDRFEKRIRKDGVRGGQISAWVKTCEEDLAKEGKLYDFLYGAQMLWSESYSSFNRYSYDKIISDMIPGLRSVLQFQDHPSLSEDAKKVLFKDKGEILSEEEKDGTVIQIGKKLQSVVFEHATTNYLRRMPWVDFDVIGYYDIFYTDGEKTQIPLTYGGNISHFDRRHNEPFVPNFYRHNGYSATWTTDGKEVLTKEGKKATLYVFEWINQKPDVAIEKIVFRACEDIDTGVIIQSITGIE